MTCAPGALALTPGWYLGVGAGRGYLDPAVPYDILETETHTTQTRQLAMGRDFNQLVGLELLLSDLGKARLDDGHRVHYRAADLIGMYRIFETQSYNRSARWRHNVHVRLGMGYLDIDSEITTTLESRVHMLAGVGWEWLMPGGVSLRAVLDYYDQDALAANLMLIKRFPAERLARPDKLPVTNTVTPAAQKTPDAVKSDDFDADGIPDTRDRCAGSPAGYPVRSDGCPLLIGTLAGVSFAPDSAVIPNSSKTVLIRFAALLKKYPAARVTLGAHTRATTNPAQAQRLTRQRITEIGWFLLQQGVPRSQVRLMAYGSHSLAGKPSVDQISISERH